MHVKIGDPIPPTGMVPRDRGRLTALLSWVDDCLSSAEVDGLERDLRSALLEEAL